VGAAPRRCRTRVYRLSLGHEIFWLLGWVTHTVLTGVDKTVSSKRSVFNGSNVQRVDDKRQTHMGVPSEMASCVVNQQHRMGVADKYQSHYQQRARTLLPSGQSCCGGGKREGAEVSCTLALQCHCKMHLARMDCWAMIWRIFHLGSEFRSYGIVHSLFSPLHTFL